MRIIPGEGVQDVLLHVSVLLRRERLRENVGELSRRLNIDDLSYLNIRWYDYTTLLIGWLRVYLNSVRFDLFVYGLF